MDLRQYLLLGMLRIVQCCVGRVAPGPAADPVQQQAVDRGRVLQGRQVPAAFEAREHRPRYRRRHLLGQVAKALRGRKSELASLQGAFLGLEVTVPGEPEMPPLRRWQRFFFVSGEPPVAPFEKNAEALAAAMADTEFAVRAESATNALFGKWRWLHIVVGCIVYAVLVVHIGAAIYFGLRWL